MGLWSGFPECMRENALFFMHRTPSAAVVSAGKQMQVMKQIHSSAALSKWWIALFMAFSLLFASSGEDRAMKKKKHFGQVYTPTYLVQDILDEAGYVTAANILERHIIDNSCGDGAFLEEVVRRYVASYISEKRERRGLAGHLSNYIHGIDVDAEAHKACLKRLNAVAEELGLKDVTWDVRNADTLMVRDCDGKMDYVVGNPPYVRVHNLAENFEKVKAFKFCDGGMTDLYLVFYEIGLKMLKDTGVLCYIAPSSWINSLAGKNMREYVRENQCLRSIVDLGHYQPFDATAYTAIVTLCRRNGGSEFDYSVYDGEHKVRPICRLTYDEAFFSGALYLRDRNALKTHREIMQTQVPRYADVKNGFATLADGVFIAADFPFSDYVIPVLKASTGKWQKCLFPYDEKGKPIPKDELFANREVRQYLLAHKDELLKGRSEAEKQDWYLFGRTQALKDVGVKKYAVNTCIRNVASIKFNRVPAGSGLYSGLYILTDVDEKVIRAVLLSESLIEYVAALKKYKSGGYYTFSSHDLEQYLNYMIHKTLPKGKKRMCQPELNFTERNEQ